MFNKSLNQEAGQSLIEYSLLLGLLALAVLGSIALLGDQVGARFAAISNAITNVAQVDAAAPEPPALIEPGDVIQPGDDAEDDNDHQGDEDAQDGDTKPAKPGRPIRPQPPVRPVESSRPWFPWLSWPW